MASLRYMISHSLAIPLGAMDKLQTRCKVQLLNATDKAVLLVAVYTGLYACWEQSGDMALVAVAVIGTLVLGFCTMLYYYFDITNASRSLMHIWVGCLLGVVTFAGTTGQPATDPNGNPSVWWIVFNSLLVVSLVLKITWAICERVLGLVTYTILTAEEFCQSLGFAVACTFPSTKFSSLWLIVAGFLFVMMSIRVRAYLAIPGLVFFISLSVIFLYKESSVSINSYPVVCFAGRILVEPLLDIWWMSGLTTMERWQVLTLARRAILRFTLLAIMGLEVTFVIFSSHAAVHHDRWYFAIPAYFVFGFLWVSLHIVFFVTCWKFINKFSTCNEVYQQVTSGTQEQLAGIMASRGMRFFTLLGRRLVLSTLLSTLLLGAVTWQEEVSSGFLGSWLAVIPLEVMVHGLLCELGSTLGGTCAGMALVGPTASCRSDGRTAPIPAASLEEASSRSLRLISIIQHFFTFHMIDVFSCDFSSSGLEHSFVKSKLNGFFAEKMEDSPRYDTYVVYYSGHVYPNGNWALTGDIALSLETILEWWLTHNAGSGSRLVIVQDVTNNGSWVKQVRRVTDTYVALQCGSISKSPDPETGVESGIGDFTREWVGFNCSTDNKVSWKDQGRKTKVTYAVSSCWSDFQFQMPTDTDMEQHWKHNFPRSTHPIIRLLLPSSSLDLCAVFSSCASCFRRCKMRWLPPLVLDTGHGFKLVRS